jgi:hypothetical protein
MDIPSRDPYGQRTRPTTHRRGRKKSEMRRRRRSESMRRRVVKMLRSILSDQGSNTANFPHIFVIQSWEKRRFSCF